MTEIKNENKYTRGKIYRIYSDEGDDVYIGSTCEYLLSMRMTKHRANYKQYLKGKCNFVTVFNIMKYDSAKIELVERYSCSSVDELRAKEGYYIRNTLGCVNKRIEGRTSKEYRDENKEKIRQYTLENKDKRQQYILDNKEEIKKQQQQYYLENKERKKQYRLDNKDKIRQYRIDNKDKIKQYYLDNKDKLKSRQLKDI